MVEESDMPERVFGQQVIAIQRIASDTFGPVPASPQTTPQNTTVFEEPQTKDSPVQPRVSLQTLEPGDVGAPVLNEEALPKSDVSTPQHYSPPVPTENTKALQSVNKKKARTSDVPSASSRTPVRRMNLLEQLDSLEEDTLCLSPSRLLSHGKGSNKGAFGPRPAQEH